LWLIPFFYAAAIHVGDQRTFEQDPKYALRLLVDIAVKALSPAINDPTTAVQAIDQIEDLLVRLAKCDLETSRAYDQSGTLRVIFQMPSWGDYLTLAFDEIRQYGRDSIQVMRRLRSALADLADTVGSDRAQQMPISSISIGASSVPISILRIAQRRGSRIDKDWACRTGKRIEGSVAPRVPP
jgi:uncharacterized membrane protein